MHNEGKWKFFCSIWQIVCWLFSIIVSLRSQDSCPSAKQSNFLIFFQLAHSNSILFFPCSCHGLCLFYFLSRRCCCCLFVPSISFLFSFVLSFGFNLQYETEILWNCLVCFDVFAVVVCKANFSTQTLANKVTIYNKFKASIRHEWLGLDRINKRYWIEWILICVAIRCGLKECAHRFSARPTAHANKHWFSRNGIPLINQNLKSSDEFELIFQKFISGIMESSLYWTGFLDVELFWLVNTRPFSFYQCQLTWSQFCLLLQRRNEVSISRLASRESWFKVISKAGVCSSYQWIRDSL